MASHYCPTCFLTFKSDPDTCNRATCTTARPRDGWADVLEAGDLLDRHYKVHSVLAVAGAGLTYRAREIDTEGKTFGPDLAIKVLYAHHANTRQLQRLATEAQILQSVSHPNLVELRGFVHRAGTLPYLVTAFESGGNLGEHLEKHSALPPRIAVGILTQILSALSATHEHGIVHRDLKAENILLAEPTEIDVLPRIRVADFGVAKVKGGTAAVTVQGAFVGTPEYAAPEQFEGRTPTSATDVFAAGCLLVECLTGETPVVFPDRTDLDAAARIWMSALPLKISLPGPPELQEVATAMLHPNPAKRPRIDRVLAWLQPYADGGEAHSPTRAPPPQRVEDAPRPRRTGLASIAAVGLSIVVTTVLCGALIGGAAWRLGYFDPPRTLFLQAPG